jgi:hypothetical protein
MAETTAIQEPEVPIPSQLNGTTTTTSTPLAQLQQREPTQFFNYPEPHYLEVPYKAPPANKNPIFRGLPLAIGAKVVANVPFIAKFLWGNAGFSGLRGLKEVEELEARYEPVVIPFRKSGDYSLGEDATSREGLRDTPDDGGVLPTEKEVEGRFWSVKDYYEAYQNGEVTPTDVANALLPIVRRDVEARTAHSTAFLSTQVELVLAAAEASTRRWKAGKPIGVLDGVPVAVKDEVDVKGYKRTFGSKKVYKEGDVDTSWCVKKWEEAGAVLIGKTNMHEVGMDTTNNNPVTGTPLNPYNDKYYTGGSSGGSGYAVGAGLVPFALGCGMFYTPAWPYSLNTDMQQTAEDPSGYLHPSAVSTALRLAMAVSQSVQHPVSQSQIPW